MENAILACEVSKNDTAFVIFNGKGAVENIGFHEVEFQLSSGQVQVLFDNSSRFVGLNFVDAIETKKFFGQLESAKKAIHA